MDYDSWKLATPPQFCDESEEDDYIDCDLCGEAVLIENIVVYPDYTHICLECIRLKEENNNN